MHFPAKITGGLRHAAERAAACIAAPLRDARGMLTVEFALCIPIVLMTVFGTIELGRLGFTKAALQHAAEEATRYAIVREGQVTPEEIEAYAASKLTGVFDRETAVIAAEAPVDPVTGTSLLTVTVNYQYQFILPFLPHDGMPLSGNSRGFIAFPPPPTS